MSLRNLRNALKPAHQASAEAKLPGAQELALVDSYEVSVGPWKGDEHAPSAGDCVFLQLDPPLDQDVQARLLDLFLQGASIQVSQGAVPRLEENQIVACRIQHLKDDWEMATPAMVRMISDGEQGTLSIGLEFIDPEQVYEHLQGELFGLRSTRSRTRVAPRGEQPKLQLVRQGSSLKAIIQDISMVGACVSVPRRQASNLVRGEHVAFSLKLPGSERHIEGNCAVMWRKGADKTVLIGLQFDLRGESHRGWSIQQLSRYIDSHLDRHLRKTG